MKTAVVRSTIPAGPARRSERNRVLALCGLIVGAVVAYLAVGANDSGDSQRNLLPYQVLARTLPVADHSVYRSIRSAVPAIEALRAQTSQWPDAGVLAQKIDESLRPADAEPRIAQRWSQFRQGPIVSYVGVPDDPASPAWILEIQEPEPGALPDPAPNDEEHHRLPDGTVLHIYVWMHCYGGQVPARFVPQPQNDGWMEVFTVPPNPVLPPRR